jgi:hypothetical protein
MVTVSAKYPHDMSEDEIQTYVRLYSEAIVKSQANLNAVVWAAPLIQLGQMELQNRQFTRNAQETRKVAYTSLVFAAFSTLLSLGAMWFAIDASRSSSRWEQRQLELLGSVSAHIQAIDKSSAQVAPAILSMEEALTKAEESKKASAPSGAVKNGLERPRDR